MPRANDSVSRPARKQHLIQANIRRRIVSGAFLPGARLPKRVELEQEFRASRVTIQRVFDRLMQDGFIYANGRGGTFVAERPPHLSRYALVFPTPLPQWNRFWVALDNEARGDGQPAAREVNSYTDIAPRLNNHAYARLVHDIHAETLAGMILASYPDELVGTPVMTGGNLPRVAIKRGAAPHGMPAVYPDTESFVDKALDFFAARQRRRVAVLTVDGFANQHLLDGLAARGLSTRPYWVQAVAQTQAPWARNCVHGLLNDGQRERPDALLITDDNLVEHAMAGVIAAGLRVPEQLEVVAHCNFPWPTPSVLPARRLGFDARQVLRTCLDLLDRQRRGEAVPPVTSIPALFEHELAQP